MPSQTLRRRRRSSPVIEVKHLTRLQRWVLLMLTVPIMWLMVLAWQQMSSALYDYQTQQWLKHWSAASGQRQAYLLENKDYHSALKGAKKALAKQPRKAEYMRNLATVYDWYLLKGDRDKPEYAEAKKQALVYFRAAAQARPLWPMGWFDLALAKARQQQLDDEFEAAILKALLIGPWEEQVQEGVAYLGFILYAYVSFDVQFAMQENMQRMVKHQPWVLLKLAKEAGQLDMACAYFTAPLPRQCSALKKSS